MNTLTNLIKDYQLGTWCRRVAWIIVAVYLIQMALQIYNISRQYGLGATPLNSGEFFQVLSFAIPYIPVMLFYFSILYVAGAVADHFAGLPEHEAIEDEETKTLAH
jgi:hypothetical protein